MHFSQVCVEA